MSGSEARFVAYAFCVGDVLIETDKAHCIRHIEGAKEWLGISAEHQLLGTSILNLVAKEDQNILRGSLNALSDASRLGPIRLKMGTQTESMRQVGVFLSHLSGKDGPTQLVITSLARIEGLIPDGSTPLADKNSFLEKLPELLSEHGKHGNLLVSLLQLADEAETEDKNAFARQLASLSVGGHSAAEIADGRYAFVHEAADKKSATHILQELAQATGQKFESATLEPDEMDEADDADTTRALVYSVRKFSEETSNFRLSELSENYTQKMQETKDRIASLRDLLQKKRFTIAYQPIVSIEDQTIHHVEALVRFDMRGGSPFELISFAEEVGVISEFDGVMLDTVINRLNRLVAKDAPASIAVNLSAKSLTTPSFTEELTKKLIKHKALAKRLLIEVTESGYITDIEHLADTINQIRHNGFAVCLDDFGAGLSGFQYLRHLKVDYVKIDGSYIRNAEHDAEQRAFLHAMVTLCRDLSIKTVGEWVETAAQHKLLSGMGVDLGQGFLFGRPKPTLPASMATLKEVS